MESVEENFKKFSGTWKNYATLNTHTQNTLETNSFNTELFFQILRSD